MTSLSLTLSSNLMVVDPETQPIVSTGIVFIDPNIDDYETLKAGVKPGLEVVLLDSSRDGIVQITEVLKTYALASLTPQPWGEQNLTPRRFGKSGGQNQGFCVSPVLNRRGGLSSLHIVTHGEVGGLLLGSGVVNNSTLDQYSDEVQSWAAALAPDADILLYGCNVAAGETGREFVQRLSELTGADVAASSNLTGSAALGGDWDLEVKVGDVDAPLAFRVEVMEGYNGVFDIRLVSVADDGTPGNYGSYYSSISADGRYVAFISNASNLVSGDTNNSRDIFVRDLLTNTTRRVSLATDGTQGNYDSFHPSISADGRYVAFSSYASNLVSGDTNYSLDIFVRDLLTNTTRLVSLATDGTQANSYFDSFSPSISADGRYVAFDSNASNLVSGDTNGTYDIFVRDLQENTTRLVSLATDGTQGNDGSYYSSISADGRYVAFESLASNLVSGDTNNSRDIFVRDLLTNTTRRVSLATDGTQGNDGSYYSSISADGRYVAFTSDASNLVSGDTNNYRDIFVRDLLTNTTRRVSLATDGTQENSSSQFPSISADGRYVAFTSYASLVSADTNRTNDVFVASVNPFANNPISYAITPGTATITEGNSGTTPLTFTVTRSGGTNAASTVDYGIGGSATFGSDYNNIGGTSGATATTGTINFAAGQTSRTITMNVLGDTVVEPNETVSVTLSNPIAQSSTSTITTAVATTTINNDDVETPGDTLATALNSGLSSAHPGTFNLNAQIGDNPNVGTTSDVDMFAFQLDAGGRVTIDIDARVNDSPLDSVLRIFDSTGNQLTYDDDTEAPGEPNTYDSYLDFTATQAGTYYVGVSSYNNFSYDPNVAGSATGFSTGKYNLQMTVLETPAETPGDTLATALNSGLSSAHPGTFNLNAQIGDNPNVGTTSDVDMIAFQLDAGGRVTIDIDARVNDSNLDSVLRIFDSTGNQLTYDDDTEAPGEPNTYDSYLDFTTTQAGTYYVGVSGFGNFSYNPNVAGSATGFSTGNYNLQMSVNSSIIVGTENADTVPGPPNSDTIYGLGGNDTIYANEGNNAVYGGAGNDSLYVGNGNDLMNGDDGNDTIYANEGNNTVYGGAGIDSLYAGNGNDLMNGDGNDTIYANEGNNTVYGGAGINTLYAGNGNDIINGGDGNDTIYANEGNNTVYGGAGNDLIYTGSGNDIITGGDGNDTIYANAGDNIINGGAGNDILWLGGGRDTVTLESGDGFDTINNFQLGQTTLHLGSDLTTSNLSILDSANGAQIYAGSDILAVVSWTQASVINNNLSTVFG